MPVDLGGRRLGATATTPDQGPTGARPVGVVPRPVGVVPRPVRVVGGVVGRGSRIDEARIDQAGQEGAAVAAGAVPGQLVDKALAPPARCTTTSSTRRARSTSRAVSPDVECSRTRGG